MSEKISTTYKKPKGDKNYTTFLKQFGEFKVSKIDQKKVSGQEYILEELKQLRRSINRTDKINPQKIFGRNISHSDINICMGRDGNFDAVEKMRILIDHPALSNVGIMKLTLINII